MSLNKYNYFVKALFLCLSWTWVYGRAFAHGAMGYQIDPINPFFIKPVLYNWNNKSCGMCCPVCGMMHIKNHLLLIG